MKIISQLKLALEQNPILIGILSLVLIFGVFAGAFGAYLVLEQNKQSQAPVSYVNNAQVPQENDIAQKPSDLILPDLHLQTDSQPNSTSDQAPADDDWKIDNNKYHLTVAWQKNTRS